MTPTEEIPFEEMCHHALQSCKVNGLTPREWRWGADAIRAFRQYEMLLPTIWSQPVNSPKGALLVWRDLPVFPMKTNGVACIARKNSTHGKHNFTF